jgi:hypothetical protein
MGRGRNAGSAAARRVRRESGGEEFALRVMIIENAS